MPFSPAYRPEPVFEALGPEFADAVAPATFPVLTSRYWNKRAAVSIGLDQLDDSEREAHFALFRSLPGNQRSPLAMRYHGHQFRVYNPDLGDGRGFLFGQQREADTSRLLDLGTKGSGTTPWSRNGDGRLTLKGGVREVLATAMLEALGVPTSRSFALYETGESLERGDEPSPTRGSVLTRLSYSHIRFGTFQRLAALGRPDLMRKLVDHVVDFYYAGIANNTARSINLVTAIIIKAARLTARWMAAGFVHGVLNTDNMNINGESFDYGPYRFLPRSDPNFTAAYFDQNGLYSFGRQPEAVLWSLKQLAGALSVITPTEGLVEALNIFPQAYKAALAEAMLMRLGIAPINDKADEELVRKAFHALADGGEQLRWEPFFFDWFGGSESTTRAMTGPRCNLYITPAFLDFRDCLATRRKATHADVAQAYFQETEPEELLHAEIEKIWLAVAERNEWSLFYQKLDGLEAARKAWGLR